MIKLTGIKHSIKESIILLKHHKYYNKEIDYVGAILSIINDLNISLYKRFMLISREFDKLYPKHIQESTTIYTFNFIKGTIEEVNLKYIKSFTYFPAFRDLDTAKLACKYLSPQIRLEYGKQKNKRSNKSNIQ